MRFTTFVGLTVTMAVVATDVGHAENAAPLKDVTVVTTDDLAISSQEYGLIYDAGWSVNRIIDTKEVFVPGTVRSMGEIEDVVIGSDGSVLSLILEVDGEFGIWGTPVNVPWTRIEMGAQERLLMRSPDEVSEAYSGSAVDVLSADQAETIVQPVRAAVAVSGAWRASELVGQTYEMSGGRSGFVRDLIIDADGKVAVVVVEPAFGVPGDHPE